VEGPCVWSAWLITAVIRIHFEAHGIEDVISVIPSEGLKPCPTLLAEHLTP